MTYRIKKYDGLTEDQLREAVVAYTEKLKRDIIQEVYDEYRFDLDDNEGLVELVNVFMDKAITKGMEWAANRTDAIVYYESTLSNPIQKVTDYDFGVDKGISGILFPDGSFVKCGNVEHHYLTEGIVQEIQFKCLYFSSSMSFGQDGIISNSPVNFEIPSIAQKEWIKEHLIFMDQGQKQIAYTKYSIQIK